MASPRVHRESDSSIDRPSERREAVTPEPFPVDILRPVIGGIAPQVDGGKRPARAAVGDLLRVEADAFIDGHDLMSCAVRFRHDDDAGWSSVKMESLFNDRWRAHLPINRLGRYRFKVRASVDRYSTWRRDLRARTAAGQDVSEEYLVGAELLHEAARRAKAGDRRELVAMAEELRALALRVAKSGARADQGGNAAALFESIYSERVSDLMNTLTEASRTVNSETYFVSVDPAKARFSTWYELFPRSTGTGAHVHGTFADVESRLDYVESMGFDVLYLPPIHPIGRTGRKGLNGAVVAEPNDPGSPWAIGADDGGHTAIHPQLGTLDDFRHLVRSAHSRGIDVALDLAFQTSPDHPWVHEHPDWFHHLPGGSIRYAENPPKRYEDIYPLNFEGFEWRSLWFELLEVVRYWIAQGVSVFRVDNPHTKPFAFWEWLIASIKGERPDVIFLAEAFTRPRVMEQLAKIGFSQSYTYFTWRSTKWEIESYLRELTTSPVADYFRPNFWPNTPDILTDELQHGGRTAFLSRLVLAATLSANYGIYGPTFELQEHVARFSGSEEYLDSEKYEIRSWDLTNKQSLAKVIALVNQIRRDHPALQFNDTLTFHHVDNEQLIAYSKTRVGETGDDVIVVVVNLDHGYPQTGWLDLDAQALGLKADARYVMHDLLTDARFEWSGTHNFVKLDPHGVPCHIFALESPTTDGTN
ncbi:MAG: putative glycanase or glycogenase with amylase domain [Acidimicrobiaceae bacterium]|nr:putative glycanase or glycogenase with amylase domain [Acidimicrobiaceae bacterium]